MSDTQILTIALAAVPTMLAVLVGIVINNIIVNRPAPATWISASTKCATSGVPSFIAWSQ